MWLRLDNKEVPATHSCGVVEDLVADGAVEVFADFLLLEKMTRGTMVHFVVGMLLSWVDVM